MTIETLSEYEVFALRYGTSGPRMRRDNFISTDLHDAPMPMDYFLWVIRDAARTIVVDTGFSLAAARQRGRIMVEDPVSLLARLGIAAATVTDVVLTHLHYDHAGNLDAFPAATFHLQDAEMAYATGRFVCHHCLAQPFDVEDVVKMVRNAYLDRVRFHDGEAQLVPGITLHRVGGHTGGLQIVRVQTRRGWLVLGSDAFHFSENRLRRSPFPLVFHIGEMLEGFRTCERLADGEDLIIPGHDPDVLTRWPRALADCANIVRVDLAPVINER